MTEINTDELTTIPPTELRAYQLLQPRERPVWLRRLKQLGNYNRPANNEEFDRPQDCIDQLNNYGYAAGYFFTTIRGSSKNNNTQYRDYGCQFHGTESRNWRGLESRKAVDEHGQVMTSRQRDTSHSRFGCPVRYRISNVLADGITSRRVWRGRWACDEIGHELGHETHEDPMSPFSIQAHLRSTPEYREILHRAHNYRYNSVRFSSTTRLLQSEFGLTIDQKTYYNLIRNEQPDISSPATIVSLLNVLQEAGFRSRVLLQRSEPSANEQGRPAMHSIFFYNDTGRNLARQYCAGHVAIIDATFCTNNKNMPLLTAVGINSEMKTFPIAMAYIPSESADAFSFFFDCIREEIFDDDIIEPTVWISDMASGIISAVDTLNALPNSTLLYCMWHAYHAIYTRLCRGRYTAEEKTEMQRLIWSYLQSSNYEELAHKRTTLREFVQTDSERSYLDSWVEKERRVIPVYTDSYLNLGIHSTGRGEQWHRNTHEATNAQMTIERSAKAICNKLDDAYTSHANDLRPAKMKVKMGTDWATFTALVSHVSQHALTLIEEAWVEIVEYWGGADGLPAICQCRNRLQFSLPCAHDLLPCFRASRRIPLSLIHPRWRIRESEIEPITGPYIPEYPPNWALENDPAHVDVGLYSSAQRRFYIRRDRRADETAFAHEISSMAEIMTAGMGLSAAEYTERERRPQRKPSPLPSQPGDSISQPLKVRQHKQFSKKKPKDNIALKEQDRQQKKRAATAKKTAQDAAILQERESQISQLIESSPPASSQPPASAQPMSPSSSIIHVSSSPAPATSSPDPLQQVLSSPPTSPSIQPPVSTAPASVGRKRPRESSGRAAVAWATLKPKKRKTTQVGELRSKKQGR